MKGIRFNKKGVGITLTWYFATIAIFIALVIFLFFAFIAASHKNITAGDKISLIEKGSSKLAIQRDLFFFLNQEVEFDGNKIMIAELVADHDIERDLAGRIFDEAVDRFVEETYPFDFGQIKPAWIKVFDADEIIEEIEGNRYPDFLRGVACDPRLFDFSIFAEQEIGDQKIVLCVNPEYFI